MRRIDAIDFGAGEHIVATDCGQPQSAPTTMKPMNPL
jgi:hypothetical protein